MSTQVQFRRGTTAENDAFTGAIGEITVDITLDELRLHDGSTAGGAVIGSSFPSGTKMLFQQTNAPTGWTKETTHNNKALRVVTGTPGSGGATAFATVFGSGKISGSTAPANAGHAHGGVITGVGVGDTIVGEAGGSGLQSGNTGSEGAGSSHTHTLSLDIQYVDFIIAEKD